MMEKTLYIPNQDNELLIECYVNYRFSQIKHYNDEFIVKCPFANHEHDKTRPAMNINKKTGQYYCHKCGAKGNLFTLAKHFSDDLRKFN